MADTNRRLVLLAPNTLNIEEVDIPEVPIGGYIVKVQHAGVCHSDVHQSTDENNPKILYNKVLGHEASGTIYKIGADAAKNNPEFKEGDKVVVYPWGNCTKCWGCTNDMGSCAMFLPGGSITGSRMYGIHSDGGFQNYEIVYDANCLMKVPEGLAMDAASTVVCSGITSLNACRSLQPSIDAALRINGKALVGLVGLGGLGLWSIQILKHLYPTDKVKVIAVDISDEKLEDAKAQGADIIHKWGTDEPLEAVVPSFLQGVGGYLNAAIDFTGLPPVQTRIFALLNCEATMTLIGIGHGKMSSFLLNGIIFRNITIKGRITGSRAHCKEMLDLVNEGKVRPPPLTAITLDDVTDTIHKMKDNNIRGRMVVKF